MFVFIKNTLLLTVGVLLVACVSTTQDSINESRKTGNFMLDKAKSVNDKMYIAGQPGLDDLASIQSSGVDRVVSFRTPEEMAKLDFNQADELNALGIQYSNIPMGGDVYPYSRVQLSALAEILQSEDAKVLLHCGSGWRASAVAVAWLIEEQGMPVNEALQHAQGWWPLPLEKVMESEFTLVAE